MEPSKVRMNLGAEPLLEPDRQRVGAAQLALSGSPKLCKDMLNATLGTNQKYYPITCRCYEFALPP